MNTLTTIMYYDDTPINFAKGRDVMVNATDMAKPFGKRPTDWLRLPTTKAFLNTLSEVRKMHITPDVGKSHFGNVVTKRDGDNHAEQGTSLSSVRQICPSQLVTTSKGNSSKFAQGTWMHEDVALEFARWLSPEFAIWCNDRIKELLTMGMTATPPTLEQMINDPELVIGLATKLKKQREENDQLITKIEADAPRVLFSKAVESSKRSCLVSELAKILKQNGVEIGQNRLFEWLRSNGYLCQKGAQRNQPTQKSTEMGLFEIKQTTITKPDGSTLVSTTTKVTGKGQIYFVNKFLNIQK